MSDKKKETPYENNLFSNHFLEERIENLDEWKNAEIEDKYEELQDLWDKKKRYLEEGNRNEDNTQDEWIDEILKIIGHLQKAKEPTHTIGNNKNLNPDYLFFKNFETKLDHEGTDNQFEEGYLIGEAKKWGRTLDKSKDNHENPAFQIFNYVDRLRTPWGLLTNGKKWRLYSYRDCEADTFYEIDLVETILKEDDRETALQNFKYFYLFFRQESFLPKRDAFLDQVYEGSESYSKDLEEDLEDDIYTALEVTARGFFETNDIEKTEENIEEVHRASLILLYRMLFILNAESRGLLPMGEKKYRLKLSLEYLKGQLEDENDDVFSEDTWAWDRRIRPLFEAINEGEQYGEFKITAYNGGLFDEDKHPFLAQHELQGNHLQRILELLAQSTDEETGDKVLVDYRDLNIRHLGSVYEGLLEHELQKAEEDLVLENGEWESATSKKDLEELPREKKVREGEVYLTNESGERKATGSYYTPEYIVEYIVENTVGPKVEEKIEESDEEELLDNVLDLNICDPAMGSGHFLTEATSFIARRVIEHGKIQDEEVEGDNEFVWVKRQVVSHCIYGVDINPLAVELGKLSLWIETMAEGKPLSFLDHHLKVGNSLVGSDIDDLKTHPDEDARDDEDLNDFGEFVKDAKRILKGEYRNIEQEPENTVEEVHKKERMYEEFKDETLFKNLDRLADIYTYQFFGGEIDPETYHRASGHVYEDLKDFEENNWYKDSLSDSKQRNYFHWELEFPKVFFGDEEGFDAVVGNPPYIRIQNLRGHMDELVEYYNQNYSTSSGKYDIFVLFLEKSHSLISEYGETGMILPNKFMRADYGEGLRKLTKENKMISRLVDFGDYQVFDGISTYTCLLFLNKGGNENFKYVKNRSDDLNDLEFGEVKMSQLDTESWNIVTGKEAETLEKIEAKDQTLSDLTDEIFQGIVTGGDDHFIVEKIGETRDLVKIRRLDDGSTHKIEKELAKKFVSGSGVRSYHLKNENKVLVYPYSSEGKNGYIPEDELEKEYPHTYEYFNKYREDLSSRGSESMQYPIWYGLWCPRDVQKLDSEKIVCPVMADHGRFYYDKDKTYFNGSGGGGGGAYGIITDDSIESKRSLVAILNSNVSDFFMKHNSSEFRGGFLAYNRQYIEQIPLPEERSERLEELSLKAEDYRSERERLNLNISDYLGSYDDGDTLNKRYSPASGVSDSPLTDTASDREKLQVGSVDTQRNGDSVTLLASARYKPENESGHDTDQYGYTETEMFSAMEFHDLSETEKALIEEFVPVAVDEAGGFADFRKKATKTMSLIDRLKKLTLPKVSDVEDDLQSFVEQRNKAEELEEKIEKTDREINEIVYDLYDLTDEEIEVVEEAAEN